METISLTKEVRIPGTDIILEKGDKIRIIPKNKIKDSISLRRKKNIRA